MGFSSLSSQVGATSVGDAAGTGFSIENNTAYSSAVTDLAAGHTSVVLSIKPCELSIITLLVKPKSASLLESSDTFLHFEMRSFDSNGKVLDALGVTHALGDLNMPAELLGSHVLPKDTARLEVTSGNRFDLEVVKYSEVSFHASAS